MVLGPFRGGLHPAPDGPPAADPPELVVGDRNESRCHDTPRLTQCHRKLTPLRPSSPSVARGFISNARTCIDQSTNPCSRGPRRTSGLREPRGYSLFVPVWAAPPFVASRCISPRRFGWGDETSLIANCRVGGGVFTAWALRRPGALVGFSKVFRVVGGQGLAGQPAGRGSAARRWKAVASSCLQGKVADIRRRRRRPPRVRRAADLLASSRRVGERIEQLVGRSPDFPAWLFHSGEQQEDGPEPFARIGKALLTRLELDDEEDLVENEGQNDRLGDKAPPTRNSTVVVITALAIEYRAVRAHLTDIEKRVHPTGTRAEIGRLPGTPGTSPSWRWARGHAEPQRSPSGRCPGWTRKRSSSSAWRAG